MKNDKLQKGFTLVEALVAISILMVAVAAPLTIAQKGLLSSIYAKNQMIAAFLAQDAIEYVKNVRDTTGVVAEASGIANTDPKAWLVGLESCVLPDSPNGCNVDSLTNYKSDGASSRMMIKRDPNNNNQFLGYGISGGSCLGAVCSDTAFTRQIKITQTSNPNEAYVDVIVKWGNGTDQIFEIGSYIYNYWGNL